MDKSTSALFELTKLCGSRLLIDNFLEEAFQKILDLLEAELCAFVKFNKTEKYLFYDCYLSKQHHQLKKLTNELPHINFGCGVEGICAQTLTVQNLSGVDINSAKEYEYRFNLKVKSILAVPLLTQGELLGVLEVINKHTENAFSKEDEITLTLFANCLASNLEISHLREELLLKDRISNLGQSVINSAHGLKNILNNMDGGAYIVEKGAAAKNIKDVEKGWDIIKRNTNRLRELVIDILLYSRPKQPEFTPSSINEICKDIEELLSPNALENKVEIKLFLDKSIPLFNFDPKGIHRCLLNLISNAIYACTQKGGGRVNISTKLKSDSMIEIVISDNGIGISENNLPYIFDVFFTTKGSSGTGLGLPVAKKIIDDHGGTIHVSSTLNIGTKFTILLPNHE